MWQFQHSVTVNNLSKEQIWAVWSDVSNWKNWDDDIASSEGNFINNSTLLIKPKNGPRITASLICEPCNSFKVKSCLPLGATLEFSHFLTQVPSGLQITHGIIIKGPLTFLFKYVIGKTVKKNLPGAMKKLLFIASGVCSRP